MLGFYLFLFALLLIIGAVGFSGLFEIIAAEAIFLLTVCTIMVFRNPSKEFNSQDPNDENTNLD